MLFMGFRDRDNREQGAERKMITIKRVAKVTAGGKRMRFSAMVVAGDRNGSVGIGLGRGADTRSAVEKAGRKAEKSMKKIQLIGDTIPHEVELKFGGAHVILRPARPGTGIIAGSAARTILELTGIDNVYAKQLGSNDLIANTYCTYDALLSLRSARVLQRMDKMKERIAYKETLNAERKEKEDKKRAEKRKERENQKRGGRFDRRGNGRRDDRFQNRDNRPAVATQQSPVKDEAKVEEVKADSANAEVVATEATPVVVTEGNETK